MRWSRIMTLSFFELIFGWSPGLFANRVRELRNVSGLPTHIDDNVSSQLVGILLDSELENNRDNRESCDALPPPRSSLKKSVA